MKTQLVFKLSLISAFAGTLTALIVTAFQLSIDSILTFGILADGRESFESLKSEWRLFLVLGGALLLGIIMRTLKKPTKRVGIRHVSAYISNHENSLPVQNAIFQFFGGMIALITGQSGGKEGPAIHLGSTSSVYLGKIVKLPSNVLQTIAGCGAAAAITTSLNSPIAGIIFAMEVFRIQYSLSTIIPLVTATASATWVTNLLIKAPLPSHDTANLTINSLHEMTMVLICGFWVGALSACFVRLINKLSAIEHVVGNFRGILCAGLITAISAIFVPEVMGVGYDTIDKAIIGEFTISAILLILVFKLLTSAAAIGLGVPVGLIGPTLLIGACAGGAIGIIGQKLILNTDIAAGFYALLGMVGMMAAVLNAPLTALLTVIELTKNMNIILPGLLVAIVAIVTMRVICKQKSILEHPSEGNEN